MGIASRRPRQGLRRWLGLLWLVALLLGSSQGVRAAPPDVASYWIDARYVVEERAIVASERATYRNLTDVPMPDLILHLYLNAFRSSETMWMQEAGPMHRGYSYDSAYPGWIEVHDVRLSNGTPLELTAVDEDMTLARLSLPQPVAPGQEVTLELSYTAHLPKVFARTGWADEGAFVLAGQWFPKFGVWEAGTWHAHPFHANSEFFADFGHYEVALTLPEGWQVAATGTLQGMPQEHEDGTVTHTFQADHVIDFAWGASPKFRRLSSVWQGVTVEVFYYPAQRRDARRVMAATLAGLERYSAWYGPYGQGLYPELTVVVVPPEAGGAGGMEYPTFFTVGALGSLGMPSCVRMVEVETLHELAHQWFQSVIATDEAEEPWLDEGLTDFSTLRAMRVIEPEGVIDCWGWSLSYLALRRLEYTVMPETPMAGAAWEFGEAYPVATYSKPVVSLATLERWQGEEAVARFLHTYATRYAFAHPTAADLRAVMEETMGAEVAAWFFGQLVGGTGTLDAQVTVTDAQRVEATRTGTLCVPVTVEVGHSTGVDRLPWPCGEGMQWEGAVQRAWADPDHVAWLDLNLANNAWQKDPDWRMWLGVLVRWLGFFQGALRGGAWW